MTFIILWTAIGLLFGLAMFQHYFLMSLHDRLDRLDKILAEHLDLDPRYEKKE